MTILRRLIRILAFTTTAITALIYNDQVSFWYALLVILLGILWDRYGSDHPWAAHIGFVGFSLLISLGVLRYGISIWFILTIHTTLALWDLLLFSDRLVNTDEKPDYQIIAKQHIDRLGYVLTASFSLSILTMYLQTRLSLIGIIICGLVVMIALSSAVKLLQRDSA